jgi:hypothetical protein
MKDLKQPLSIKSSAIASLACQSVARALSVRQSILELTPGQTDEVGGGVAQPAVQPSLKDALLRGRIYGGIIGDLDLPIFGIPVSGGLPG